MQRGENRNGATARCNRMRYPAVPKPLGQPNAVLQPSTGPKTLPTPWHIFGSPVPIPHSRRRRAGDLCAPIQ